MLTLVLKIDIMEGASDPFAFLVMLAAIIIVFLATLGAHMMPNPANTSQSFSPALSSFRRLSFKISRIPPISSPLMTRKQAKANTFIEQALDAYFLDAGINPFQ